jgi:hypothetical protein
MTKFKCQNPNFKFNIWHLVLFHLEFAMNHVRFMISPELYVVQETLAFDIAFFDWGVVKR